MKTQERYVLTIGEPPCYVLVDATSRADYRDGPRWAKLDEPYQRAHVISPARGGEVRSYWLARGGLYHADCNPLAWPEMDEEVSRAMGVPVKGWTP